MKDNETVKQLWRRVNDEILYVVEQYDKKGSGYDYPADILFAHVPKFSYCKWIICLIGLAVLSLVGAFFIRSKEPSCGWWSSLLLSASMGIVVGILMYFCSIIREGVIVGYGEVHTWLKERIDLFDSLFSEGGALQNADPYCVFANNDNEEQGVYDLLKINDLCLILTRFFYYIQHKLAPVYSNYSFIETIGNVESRNEKRDKKISMIRDMFHSKKTVDSELKQECCRLVMEDFQFIKNKLKELEVQLQSDVYGIRMGKSNVKTWQQLKKDNIGKGGVINEEIRKAVGLNVATHSKEASSHV